MSDSTLSAIDRIEERVCPVCRQIFYTDNLQKVCCSASHARTYWNHQHKTQKAERGERAPRKKREPVQPVASSFDRPFMAWDGEGWDGQYTLLANSSGAYIYEAEGLSTEQCCDFILEYAQSSKRHRAHPYNHVAFGFGYDVNMILKDLPLVKEHHSIQELYKQNWTLWHGYRIQYIPRKSFTLSKDGRSVTIFDSLGFFQSSFVKALTDWKIPVSQAVLEGKLGRSEFATWKVEDVIAYNAEECTRLVELMDKLREAMRSAGLLTKRWDGSGALAAEWLRLHNASGYLVPTPVELAYPSAVAYSAGRIELAGWGRVKDPERLWHWDIHSAYPDAMRFCPDLTQLTWHHTRKQPEEDFSLVHVTWNIPQPESPHIWGPFPWRTKSNAILYPLLGEGWYWNVEVKAAQRRFHDCIRVEEAWAPTGVFHYPFRSAIEQDYAERARRKRGGDPSNVVIKLALNSLYGKLAQKKGFDGKPPKYYQLMWAGYITSRTRAKISDALYCVHDEAILVMTDGIYALRDMDPGRVAEVGFGFTDALGDWEESDEVAGEFIGAGLYKTWNAAGEETSFKQRGFGADAIDYEAILDEWEGKTQRRRRHFTTLRRFVGMGIALMSSEEYRPQYRQFVDVPREILSVPQHGTSKRMPDFLGGTLLRGVHFQRAWESDGTMSQPYIKGAGELSTNPEYALEDKFREGEE